MRIDNGCWWSMMINKAWCWSTTNENGRSWLTGINEYCIMVLGNCQWWFWWENYRTEWASFHCDAWLPEGIIPDDKTWDHPDQYGLDFPFHDHLETNNHSSIGPRIQVDLELRPINIMWWSSNIIKYHQISSNIIKYHQISSNIIRYHGIHQISWNMLHYVTSTFQSQTESFHFAKKASSRRIHGNSVSSRVGDGLSDLVS